MTTLSSLLSSIGPTQSGNPPGFLRVYHTSFTSVSNGGCCCLWTVPASPAGITSVKFELWGGGASGNDGCCCAWTAYEPTSGNYVKKQQDTTAGCQYRICAGGSTACAYQISNVGCTGCSSYVYDVTAGTTIACACGGESGSSQPGFTSPFTAYTCCWGRINGGNNTSRVSSVNDIDIMGTGNTSHKIQHCFTEHYSSGSGGWTMDGWRSFNFCDTTWYRSGQSVHSGGSGYGMYPGGPGVSGIACGDGRCWGSFGAGGLVILTWS